MIKLYSEDLRSMQAENVIQPDTINLFLSILMGLGLSASCGFRIFAPFLVMGVASQAGYLTLSTSFLWVADTYAIATFAVATFVEIGAYYIPWLDNLLDTIATPTAMIAGTLATASVSPEMTPLMQWTIAAIGGGGLSAGVKLGSAAIRGASTLATAGTGNFMVSSAETSSSFTVSVIAIAMPILVLLLLTVLTYIFYKAYRYLKVSKIKVS